MSQSGIDSKRLNQQAAHDTGLYDPDRHDNQIVAMYDTDAQARAAQAELVKAGIPADAVRLAAKGADTGTLGGVDTEHHDDGVWGTIRSLFAPDDDRTAYGHAVSRGHALLIVTPRAEMDRQRLVQTLERTNPVDFDARLEEWRQAGYDTASPHPADQTASMSRAGALPDPRGTTATSGVRPMGSATPGMGQRTTATDSPETLKVAEEQLRVGKRVVESGAARIRSYVIERPVEEQVRLREERVQVERRPVDRAVTAADTDLFQERTIEARATSEEAVVSKEARVVEEVGLHKESNERTDTIRDTVRETKVEVENGIGNASSSAATKGAGTSGANAPRR